MKKPKNILNDEDLALNLYDVVSVRKIDEFAATRFSLSCATLMDRAGLYALRIIQTLWPKAKSLIIFVGHGNNAGDGYVLAKYAKENNFKVLVVQAGIKTPKNETLAALQQAVAAHVAIEQYQDQDITQDIVVDALLGTGCAGNLHEQFVKIINKINSSHVPVLALDIPSGLCGNTGTINSVAIHATATITFGGNKLGMFIGHAYACCGKIYFYDLDLPQEIYKKILPIAKIIKKNLLKLHLPKLLPHMHKGNLGKVCVVGGEPGMAGATILAGISALRANAGLVTIITHTMHAYTLMLGYPEITTKAIQNGEELEKLINNNCILLFGPGLGTSLWAQNLLASVLKLSSSMVVDADGLNLLSKIEEYHDNWILTPHLKEAARLLNCGVEDIMSDRFAAAHRLQKKYGGVIVLKGAGTIIASKNKTYICPIANPGLATAGMGDVLSGIIASFLAQGLDLLLAATCGVWLHAQAGIWLTKTGTRGIIASDMFLAIKKVLHWCQKNEKFYVAPLELSSHLN